MAYYMQELLSATAGGSAAGNDAITIVNGSIADSFINKAVTFAGQPADLANPTVKLAGDGEIVIGSIIGVSYGKLQIAVSGWDIRFLQDGVAAITPGSRIIGSELMISGSTVKGFVKAVPGAAVGSSPSETTINTAINAAGLGRGSVLHGGDVTGSPTAGSVIIRVTMRFGA